MVFVGWLAADADAGISGRLGFLAAVIATRLPTITEP